MRAIWSGSITFGLITIPIKLYTAVSSHRPSFKLLHEKDGERVHYKRFCNKGHEVSWDDIIKGYEYSKDHYVTFADEELEALDTNSVRSVDIETFVPLDDIDPIYYDKTYYVAPEESGLKAYRLLVKALDAESLVGVAKVAIREKEHLAALRLKDGMIVLETMHWPDEIRDAEFDTLDKRTPIRENEVKMARQLVRQLAGKFDPDEFQDDYKKALDELIQRKIDGEEITAPEPEEKPAEVLDLMEALRASVEQAKKGKKPSPPKKERKSRKAPKDDDYEEMTKEELYNCAKEFNIPGRSSMARPELIEALREAS